MTGTEISLAEVLHLVHAIIHTINFYKLKLMLCIRCLIGDINEPILLCNTFF